MKISHNNTKLKQLIQSDFKMKIVEDLGMEHATDKSIRKYRMAIFKCNQCERTPKIMVHHARKNKTRVCPFCANSNANKTHGYSKHILYDTYLHMMDRCFNKKNIRYIDYGERGITVSEELRDIKQYIKYISSLNYAHKENYSIDRIDNDGNYERGNLRWASKSTQAQNTRRLMSTNTSGYRGVCFNKRMKTWYAQIIINRKHIHLGYFKEKIDGAKAYDKYIANNNLEHTRNF